jgi:hypothetical protein
VGLGDFVWDLDTQVGLEWDLVGKLPKNSLKKLKKKKQFKKKVDLNKK